MKSTIPLFAIAVVAAWVLAGCNKDNSSNSTGMSSPNPSMGNTNGMMGGMTNMPATHNMSDMSMAASNGMSKMSMPAGTNQ